MRKDLSSEIDWTSHAIFLDFDGTLSPIVPEPDQATISEQTRRDIECIRDKAGGAVAILSGRDMADLDRMLAPLQLPLAASHGVLRRTADGQVRSDQHDAEALSAAADEMDRLARERGLLVERKAGAVTIHYRRHPEAGRECRELVERIAAASPALRALHGNMVSEAVLRGVDKGQALKAFMGEAPFTGRTPIAAGDDTTDEDAFAAAESMHGFGIKIGAGETAASQRFERIEAFLAWLHRAAEG